MSNGRFEKGYIPWNKGRNLTEEEIFIISLTTKEAMKKVDKNKLSYWKGKKQKKETIEKRKCVGEKNGLWKGGVGQYWHEKARGLFGLGVCRRCGITQEEHLYKYDEKLHMHCNSTPKDYTLMIDSNWLEVCRSCHSKIDLHR